MYGTVREKVTVLGESLFMFYLFCMSFAAFSDSITDIVQKWQIL